MQVAAGWSPDRWREVLTQVMDAAKLGQADLVKLSGIAQATASRWVAGASQPGHRAVRRLVDNLAARYPELGDLPAQLLAAAGYGEGYIPDPAGTPWEQAVASVRRKASAIPDPVQRERVERIIERELRETDELLHRRVKNLEEVIGLALPEGFPES